ncbi:MMPL family transporter [Kribbella sandramycini]|uniref:MMPL family transporter n=1 Tax=Kribbella sandramycini TaxID=60450 RepID=UPI00192E1ED4
MGGAAVLSDTKQGVADRLSLAALIIIGTTTVLLFALTGSLLIPLQAILRSSLSLTATFGAMVLVFQRGHLLGDFTVTGWIDLVAPVLMFCVAYGLAMDYEVFLISGIQEQRDAGRHRRRPPTHRPPAHRRRPPRRLPHPHPPPTRPHAPHRPPPTGGPPPPPLPPHPPQPPPPSHPCDIRLGNVTGRRYDNHTDVVRTWGRTTSLPCSLL